MKLNVRGEQGHRTRVHWDRVLGERATNGELQKSPPLTKQSSNQHQCVRNLHRLGKEPHERITGNSVALTQSWESACSHNPDWKIS
jgi:hypothetical protein